MDDDVDLRRLRQTMRLAHWSVCPSQVAPMTRGSVDLDDSVHRSLQVDDVRRLTAPRDDCTMHSAGLAYIGFPSRRQLLDAYCRRKITPHTSVLYTNGALMSNSK